MLDYAQIAPLVAQRQVEGRRVRVRFACPQTGYSVESTASLTKANTAGQRLKDGFKRNFISEARNVVGSALGNVLGRGIAGRMARQATYEASRAAHGAFEFGEGDIQRGIVSAFRSVQHSFKQDASGRWMHASAAGGGGLPGLGSFGGGIGSQLASALGGGGGAAGGLAALAGGSGAGGLAALAGGGGAGGLAALAGGGGAGGLGALAGGNALGGLGALAGGNALGGLGGGARASTGGGWGTMATAAGAGAVGGGLAGLVGGGLASLFGKGRGGGSSGQSGWSRLPGQQQAPPAQSGWSRQPGGQAPAAPPQPQQPAGQSGWSRLPGQQQPQSQPGQGGWPQQQQQQSGWSRLPGQQQAQPQPGQGGWQQPQLPPGQGGWQQPQSQPGQGGWPQPQQQQQSGWSRQPGGQAPQPAPQPGQGGWPQQQQQPSGWSRLPGGQAPQHAPPPGQGGWPQQQPGGGQQQQQPQQGGWPQQAPPPPPAPPPGYSQPACGGQAEFDTVLRMHPPQGPDDRSLLVRLLVDLARVDGAFDPDESHFLGTKLAGADLRQVATQPPLTPADLGRLSPGVRPSAVLLAHATAFADGSVSAREKSQLAALEQATGLPREQLDYLRKVARGAIVERLLSAIYGDGHKSVEEAIELEKAAIELDIGSAELTQLDAAFRARRGL